MSETLSRDLKDALDEMREAVVLALDGLGEPYSALATTEPDAALGAPLPVGAYRSPVSVRALAERIEANGRNAWALRQVEERETQLRELVEEFRRGAFATTAAADWTAMVEKFREALLADILTARQDPRGWARIDLSNRSPSGNGAAATALLTPRDVAAELSLSEREVRRRIQEGLLGPWHKSGSRWVISREAYLRHWERAADDADLPRPTGSRDVGGEAFRRLDHYHLGPAE